MHHPRLPALSQQPSKLPICVCMALGCQLCRKNIALAFVPVNPYETHVEVLEVFITDEHSCSSECVASAKTKAADTGQRLYAVFTAPCPRTCNAGWDAEIEPRQREVIIYGVAAREDMHPLGVLPHQPGQLRSTQLGLRRRQQVKPAAAITAGPSAPAVETSFRWL